MDQLDRDIMETTYDVEKTCNNHTSGRHYWSNYRFMISSKGVDAEFKISRKENELPVKLQRIPFNDSLEEDQFCINDDSEGIFAKGCV